MIDVLIVEDDPMVAELNKRYVDQIDDFNLKGVAENVEEALHFLRSNHVNLILLDVYMPGKDGLQLLKVLREEEEHVDVILITAASEKEQIQQALRLGVIDYLIKPFEFDRLKEALNKYIHHSSVLQEQREVSQSELDRIFSSQKSAERKTGIQVPKGLTETTLQHIIGVIQMKNDSFSTDEIAQEAEVSRVSVRKYLKFLKDIDFLEENLIYGVGRPVYQYRETNAYEKEINFYH